MITKLSISIIYVLLLLSILLSSFFFCNLYCYLSYQPFIVFFYNGLALSVRKKCKCNICGKRRDLVRFLHKLVIFHLVEWCHLESIAANFNFFSFFWVKSSFVIHVKESSCFVVKHVTTGTILLGKVGDTSLPRLKRVLYQKSRLNHYDFKK